MLGAVPYSVTQVYNILSKCQQLVNLLIGRVTDTGTLTTVANTYFYDLRTELPTAMRIISVVESGRTLRRFTAFNMFAEYSRTWLADTGSRFEAWHQLGAHYLIVYPAKVGASSAEVTFVKATAAMATQTDTFELADEDVPLVIDLAEILLLVSIRRYEELKLRIAAFVERIKDYE
jgi:hypothetical protein